MDLRRVLQTIHRRRLLIGGLVGITVVTVAIISLFLPPSTVYQARATLMPSEYALTLGGFPGRESSTRDIRLTNLRELVGCRAVAERAVAMMGEDASPVALQKQVSIFEPPHESWQSGSDLIYLQVEGSRPQEAVRQARAVSQAFVSFYENLAKSGAAATRSFLEQEALNAKGELDARRAALISFQRSYGLATSQEGVDSSVRLKNLAELQAAVDDTRAQLQEAGSALTQASADMGRQPANTIVQGGTSESPLVQQLENQLALLEAELASESAIHTAEHPRVVALGDKVAALRERLKLEQGRLATHSVLGPNPVRQQLEAEVVRLRSQRAALAGKLAALNGALARRRGALNDLSGADVTLDGLTADYKQAQAAYADLTSHLNQARIDERVAASRAVINIVDLPTAAEGPVRQGRGPLELMLAGAVLSFVLATGLALVIDTVDVRLEQAEDVLVRMKLPVTATIPSMAGMERAALPRASYLAPLSPTAEAYRFLRSELIFSDPGRDVRAILVATPKPGQGGTLTCTNLAISMAQAGKRVVLVDADMRRPSLHDIFGTPKEPGLSDFLEGDADLVDALKPTEVANLLLMSAGRPTNRPAELLGSDRMKLLVSELKRHADYIFFDSPAAVAFTDATLVSAVVDGVLLVVRASVRFTGAEVTVRQRMEKAGANFLGVVLNDLPPEQVESCRYHTHYYGTDYSFTRQLPWKNNAEPGETQ